MFYVVDPEDLRSVRQVRPATAAPAAAQEVTDAKPREDAVCSAAAVEAGNQIVPE